MKLLIVSTWLPYPPDNGSRLRAYHLLQQLSRGHELTLLAFGTPDCPDDLSPLGAVCRRLHVVTPTPLRSGHLGFRGLLSGVPRYFVQSASAEMKALVESTAPRHDAAVALQVNAATYIRDRADMPRVSEEVEVGLYRHARAAHTSIGGRWRRALTRWKFERFIGSLVGSFERSTVVSNVERDHLAAIGCDCGRTAVVPNGIAADEVLRPRTSRSSQLIYPGSVTYWANLDAVQHFIRNILPLIRRVCPTVTLVVTGSTDGVDVRDLAAADGVTFTGRLPEVDSLLSESAVCVVPLRVGGGTRLKVLHAMASGTPVVSTGMGVEGLDVEPEQHVLIGEAPETFAAQVVRVIKEPLLADGLSRAGHALVRQRYAWEPVGALLEGVIQEAVGAHASRRAPCLGPRGL